MTASTTKPTTAATTPKTTNGSSGPSDDPLSLEVPPRKPRLAWQGMDRRELAESVPTQVVEIVRPGKATRSDDKLPGITAAQQGIRLHELPPNRLIWTNDNLVALRTLLDERDPVTREYRYRGKIDLVYIDPPFMVNNDFMADNAIDIELDDDEGVQAKKEPSLVEILAYKDTWRQGLDSFLSMLRARLVLLKDLLATTGSIYVHLDWHAVHYVKVLMDEIFGYENFRNEIVWKRKGGSANPSNRFGTVTDTLLFYSAGPAAIFETLYSLESDDVVRYIAERFNEVDERGRKYRKSPLVSPNPRPNLTYEYRGFPPPPSGWSISREVMEQWDREGRLCFPKKPDGRIERKAYLDEYIGQPVQNLWTDVFVVNPAAAERLNFPTQKPLSLVERIIRASCPPGGTVLDCFIGSGTTAEAAERLGRHWIGVDNGKFAIHLARKRLIQLHGQSRPAEVSQAEYVECDKCHHVERKEKANRSRGAFNVRPFTVENMGVYQRAEHWQNFQTHRSHYRDEMIKVFGGEPINHSPLLHGRKDRAWVHIGPLDGPVSSEQIWAIAREAQRTDMKAVTVLSADFDPFSGTSERDAIKEKTGVVVTVRVIPKNAIDEVKRRLEIQLRASPETSIESMAIPAFYAPLSIVLSSRVTGRLARVSLDRCEIDIESFLASQRPILTGATKKKVKAETEKWHTRKKELEKWLAKANTWEKFVDFWAVDWDYRSRLGDDDKPIFETDWQSFRVRKGKDKVEDLVLTAEYKYEEPGRYQVAARVTDVFGNDGIATVTVEVK